MRAQGSGVGNPLGCGALRPCHGGGGSFIYVGEWGCRILGGLLEVEPLRARRDDGDRQEVADADTGDEVIC